MSRRQPYPAYRDSGVEWLGRVPEHWQVRRLKRISQKGLANGLFKKKSEFGTGAKLVNVVDAYTRDFAVRFERLDRVQADEQELRSYVVRPGDVFFVRSSLKREGVGVSVLALEVPEPAVFECHLVRCRPLTSKVMPQFLINYLNATLTRQRLVALSETTTMTTVGQGSIASLQVVVPPLPEQRAIAAFLDRETAKLDALVEEKQRLIELLEEKRTALISHAVTKGPDPNVPMKDSAIEWIGEIPEHWETKHLMHLTDPHRPIMYGIVLPGPNVGDGVPIVKGGDVAPGRLRLELLNRTTHEIESGYARSRLRGGDIVYAIRGSIGATQIVPCELEGANLTQDAARIAPRDGVSVNWLVRALASRAAFSQLEAGALGATIRGINIRDLKRVLIPVPTSVDQEAIAGHLREETAKLDALVAKVREGIEKLQEYRTALISAAVTGKIDVREEVQA